MDGISFHVSRAHSASTQMDTEKAILPCQMCVQAQVTPLKHSFPWTKKNNFPATVHAWLPPAAFPNLGKLWMPLQLQTALANTNICSSCDQPLKQRVLRLLCATGTVLNTLSITQAWMKSTLCAEKHAPVPPDWDIPFCCLFQSLYNHCKNSYQNLGCMCSTWTKEAEWKGD